MPEPSASLEELLEAAETAVARPQFSPRPLALTVIATVGLLMLVSVTLGVASGGGWNKETRLLELVAPARMTPEAYLSRLRLQHTETTFHKTPFGTQEIHVTGELLNAGSHVLARATLVLTLDHLFQDRSFQYTFPLASPTTEGVGQLGPLFAHASRTFHYRVPDFPPDITPRDVRTRWEVRDVELGDGAGGAPTLLEPVS